MKNIEQILKKFKIKKTDVNLFGEYIAKVKPIYKQPDKNKKLILVTAISPTPAGEGKTTISVGLNDAINKLGHKCVVALREPSMGPVFGVKGGANGGGKAQIIPKDDIDLHFTGDMHAITAANNLIAATIDNHIFWGNELKIDTKKIIWRRVLDINDRSLRNVEITIDHQKNIIYKSGFDITAASEIMAIFCLSNTPQEMHERINNIIVAYSTSNKPIYVKDLKITNAIMKILEGAIWPNAVQSLEGNLALVHGGPFANIAHGCNSVIATKTAMNISDYTITEAGFGSDLGAEKFLDIVCNNSNLKPNVVVLVASIRSLKMHGGLAFKELDKTNINFLKKGLENLEQHIKNIRSFNLPCVIAINKFDTDTKQEIDELLLFAKSLGVECYLTSVFAEGSKGAINLAKKVVELAKTPSSLTSVYSLNDKLEDKIFKIVTRCYGASDVEYSNEAKIKLKLFNNKKTYVCMAKTPLTFSDNPKEIIVNKPFKIHVQNLLLVNGANFIVVMSGNIFRMPGLPKVPAAITNF